MRRVRKTHPPQSLRHWIAANRELPNFNYDTLPSRVKADLKKQLLAEQGFICAYTGLGIVDTLSHIEHLKPQCECEPGEDVAYRNLLACFPRDGGDTSYGYGSPIKGDWWNEDLFISPLMDECSRRFSFAWSGRVEPNPRSHRAAGETIRRLGLGSKSLVSLRRSAIKGFFGFGMNQERISKQEARRLLSWIDNCNANGERRPFCFVFAQLLPKYIAGNL